jgi:hypothetical protein
MLLPEETAAELAPVEEPPIEEPSATETEAVSLAAPVSDVETAEAVGTTTADDTVTAEVVADAYERGDTFDDVVSTPYLSQDAVETVEAVPSVAAQSEVEAAQELPEMAQVEEETHLADAPKAEPAYHADEAGRDSDLAVPTPEVAESVQEPEPTRVSYAEPQPEATLLTEQAGTMEPVQADAGLPAVAATVSTDESPQDYSEPEPVQAESDHDDGLVYMPEPVAADTSGGQPAPPQHLDPQTWTPPPPPPTPYGVPPIRANEDMWPAYVPLLLWIRIWPLRWILIQLLLLQSLRLALLLLICPRSRFNPPGWSSHTPLPRKLRFSL